MATASQVNFVRESLRSLVENLYQNQYIDRGKLLAYLDTLRSRVNVAHLASQLYGPRREAFLNKSTKLVRLSLKDVGGRRFSLLVLKPVDRPAQRRRPTRCLVGHRFTAEIKSTFRWNLRQVFELFQISAEYSGFDGASVQVLADLRRIIQTHDFCLFDNRETTNPSKPNVYIEAGMAFMVHCPFIFCHYKGEAWPTDFSNVHYISYKDYARLFRELYLVLPVFLRRHVLRKAPGLDYR